MNFDRYRGDIFENDDMEDDILYYFDILIRRKNKDHVLDNNGKKLLSL